MRITESRLLTLATEASARARDLVGEAQEVATSGREVARPSDDATRWAAGRRAELRALASRARGGGMIRARHRLDEVDRALQAIGAQIDRAREIAVGGANGTLGAGGRAALAEEVRQLRAQALALANSRGADGEYLFAGAGGDGAPFDAAGVYAGDATVRTAELAEGLFGAVGQSGEVLTAASGVDVFAELTQLADGLDADDTAAIQTSVEQLGSAREQVAEALADVGVRARAVADADDTRADFELALARVTSDSVDADPINAFSTLSRALIGLDAARAVSERIAALLRG